MANLQTINFSALQSADLLHVSKAPLDRLPLFLKLLAVTALFLLFPVVLVAIFIFWAVIYDALGWGLGTLVFILSLAVFAYAGKRQRVKQRRKVDAVTKFARENGWAVANAGKKVPAAGQYLSVHAPPEAQMIQTKSIQGTLQEHPFELVIGLGAGEVDDSMPASLVMYVKVNKKLPKAVLVSRELTDDSSLFDRFFTGFEDAQQIDLEGDFNKDFQLYVPRGKHLEAMSLIAPDFMQTAVAHVSRYTIELSDNTLCLLSRDYELSAEAIENIFNATQSLLKEL